MAMNSKVMLGLAAVVAVAAGVAAYMYFGTSKPVVLRDVEDYVFVQSTKAPEMTLIDVVEDVVAARLTLAAIPDELLVAREPKRVIYSNRESKTIHIYDIATQADEAVLTLPFSPDNVVMSPDSYVLAVSGDETGQVAVIDLTDNSIKFVLEQTFYKPNAIVFSDDSVFLFISDSLKGQVLTVDTGSGAVLDPIQLSLHMDAEHDPDGSELSALTRTPNGLYGLVTLNTDGFVSVINMRNWSETKVMRVGKGASRAYGTADGVFMMVGNDDDRSVSIISSENWQNEATLPGVAGVTSISTGFFERLAYVVSNAQNKVAIIDLEKMETVKFIDLPGGPGEAVSDADGKKMYVALRDTNELAVIDVYNQKIHKIIKNVGTAPWGIAMAVTNNYCH